MNWWSFTRQPSVAERRARALKEAKRFAKQGKTLAPVVIAGRAIAETFWGKAWCDNLESYRDYEYRLPRGRSYVRNRAVLDLEVGPGSVRALVSGTSLYRVEIKIKPLAAAHWKRLRSDCAGEIGSLVELLQGRLSDRVMRRVAHREQGMFPKPAEIEMSCSCPDWAAMCKHVAAVMYGVGARLDAEPELLFKLRKVDHAELIAGATNVEVARRSARRKTIATDALESVFGIELDVPDSSRPRTPTGGRARAGKGAKSRRTPPRVDRAPAARKRRT